MLPLRYCNIQISSITSLPSVSVSTNIFSRSPAARHEKVVVVSEVVCTVTPTGIMVVTVSARCALRHLGAVHVGRHLHLTGLTCTVRTGTIFRLCLLLRPLFRRLRHRLIHFHISNFIPLNRRNIRINILLMIPQRTFRLNSTYQPQSLLSSSSTALNLSLFYSAPSASTGTSFDALYAG